MKQLHQGWGQTLSMKKIDDLMLCTFFVQLKFALDLFGFRLEALYKLSTFNMLGFFIF